MTTKSKKSDDYVNLDRLNVYVTPELKKWYKEESARRGLKMSAYVSTILNDHMNQQSSLSAMQFMREMLNSDPDVQAAGGFKGVLRDLARMMDEI